MRFRNGPNQTLALGEPRLPVVEVIGGGLVVLHGVEAVVAAQVAVDADEDELGADVDLDEVVHTSDNLIRDRASG